MAKILLTLVAAVAVGGGGYYVYQQNGGSMMSDMSAESMGTYSYECDERVMLDATISANANSIVVKAAAGGAYPPETTLVRVGTSNRFEGAGIVLVGDGETVILNPDEEAVINCSPVQNPDMAPFNWGDDTAGVSAGADVSANVVANVEVGGSVKQDTSLIVTESIEGKWQSTQDAKSAREFKANGTVVDWYDNEIVSEGKYSVFTKLNAPKLVAFPIDANAVYVQMTMKGTQADTLDFKVTKLTETQLEMVYMTRGGVQTYTRVQ